MSGSKLSNFLKERKSLYLDAVKEGKGGEWTVVMGNEAGDLDSIASAIAYAWFTTRVNGEAAVPLTQTPRVDLHLRAENLHAFELARLNPDTDILCVDDVPCAPSAPFPSSRFALVDHNRLQTRFSRENPTARVVAVLDHHQDEGLYHDTADLRLIVVPTGSCASLVTQLFESHPEHMPPELATLLLCSILIDTSGLKPGGKAEAADHRAAQFLIPLAAATGEQRLITLGGHKAEAPHETPGLHDLHATLQEKKASVAHLSTADLLRRDYKEYTMVPGLAPSSEILVGLSSVPVGFESWLPGDPEFWRQTETFMADRGLAVLGILTSFRDAEHPGKSGRGKHRREQMYVVRGHDELSEVLFDGLGDAEELKLKRRKFPELGVHKAFSDGVRAHAWEQKNVDATRKATAPLVKAVIEGQSKSANL